MPLPIMLAHKLVRGLSRARGATACSTTCGPTASRRSRSSTTATSPVRIDAVVALDAAQPRRSRTTRSARTSPSRSSSTIIPAELMDTNDEDLRQPDRPLRHRRPARRRRRHRPQDHRRHLRRRGAARRRRVLGQGSDEGRPLGLLHGALHRQERRRRRPRRARARAARLRDRRRRPGVGAGRHVRHRHGSPTRSSPSSCARTSS